MLKIENLTYKRGPKTIFENLNLELRPKEVLGVIGKNGEGKTSLLNLMCGLVKPHGGNIFYDGKNIKEISLLELKSKRAVLSQNFSMNFDMSVYDILLMAKRAHGKLQKRDFDLIDEICEIFDIKHFLNRSILRLSGGETQRVLFAKTILQLYPFDQEHPSYLFFDEPTSALDLELQQKILMHLKMLTQKYNVGIFVILHDLNHAAHYCDRLALLSNKEIVKVGHPKDIVQKEIIDHYFRIESHVILNDLTNRPILTI